MAWKVLPILLALTAILMLASGNQRDGFSDKPDCKSPEKRKYRTISGTCNNLKFPVHGRVKTHFRRLLPPAYERGNNPVDWYSSEYNGYKKPSPRLVIRKLFTASSPNFKSDALRTDFWTSWGQFLAHDIDHAPQAPESNNEQFVKQCGRMCHNHKNCFPIQVPPGDPRVRGRCMPFVRSHRTTEYNGHRYVEDQINNITHWMDGSMIYGSYDEQYSRIRDFGSYSGQLRKGTEVVRGKHYLPFDDFKLMDCKRNRTTGRTPRCFLAGDKRCNIQVGLTTFHTLWFREHNRIASKLHWINPHWDRETVFQETRKIVVAEWQHMTYSEYLPLLLGSKGYAKLGKYRGYQPDVDARASSVFASTAFRLHVAVHPKANRLTKDLYEVPEGHMAISDTLFNPSLMYKAGGLDVILRGMIYNAEKAIKTDQLLSNEMSDKLFVHAQLIASDLGSINIQRGRDHGMANYLTWRKFLGLPAPDSCVGLQRVGALDLEICKILEKFYGSPANFDLWPAGVCERIEGDNAAGETFTKIMTDTFWNLRAGDRFWYEERVQFTVGQLREIKKTSVARLLCDNGNDIDEMTPKPLRFQHHPRPVSCKKFPQVNLEAWREKPRFQFRYPPVYV